MKKSLLTSLLAAGILLCASQESYALFGFGKKKKAEKTEINFQIVWGEESGRGKAIQELVDDFEEKNPNIDIKLIGGTQNSQSLLTSILGGDAAEVIQVPNRQVQALGDQGAFIELDKEFGKYENNYTELLWNMGSVEDTLYGMPWIGHSIQLVYNETAFEAAGISKAPETWEELYSTAKALTIDKDGDGKIDQYGLSLVGKQHPDLAWLFTMFLEQAGGKLIKYVNGEPKVAINSPEGLEALNFYMQLIKDVTPPDTLTKDGGDVMSDFRSQVTVMEFQGPWGVTDIWKNGNPFKVSAARVPAGKSGRNADVGPYMLTIPEGLKKNKETAALKLVDYLISKEAQEMIMGGEIASDGNKYPFRVPIRKDMQDLPYFKEHAEFLPFIEGMAEASIRTPLPAWQKVEDEVYISALNRAFSGIITPEEALEEIEDTGNQILANF